MLATLPGVLARTNQRSKQQSRTLACKLSLQETDSVSGRPRRRCRSLDRPQDTVLLCVELPAPCSAHVATLYLSCRLYIWAIVLCVLLEQQAHGNVTIGIVRGRLVAIVVSTQLLLRLASDLYDVRARWAALTFTGKCSVLSHIICVPRNPQATLISSTPREMRTSTV